MSLSPAHVRLVQTSFEVVRPIADTAAALFYRRLFELEPRLRPLFTHDLNDQGRKLMTMLTLVVKNLDRPEHLIPAAQQLGARHVRYGVEARHYDVVGQALLWTLGQGLGERFTPDVEEAWAAAYTVLAGVMIEAAAQAVEQADDEGARTGAAVGGAVTARKVSPVAGIGHPNPVA